MHTPHSVSLKPAAAQYIRKRALGFRPEYRRIHVLQHTQKPLIYQEAILQVKANLAIKIVCGSVAVRFQQIIPFDLFFGLLFTILE
jgi:hypothetical protein